MTDTEKDFWDGKKHNGFLGRIFFDANRERRNWFFVMLVLCIAVFFYGGLCLASMFPPEYDYNYVTATDWITDKEQEAEMWKDADGVKVVLLLGYDKRPEEDVSRSDTIMLVCLRPEEQEALLVSIPRDTYVNIAGSKEKTKINHAYAYGGAPLTQQTITDLLGVEVDDYVEVNFDGFAAMVDALGGIDMEVEMRMVNNAEGIDLQPGMQHLDGAQALQYVRYRDNQSADIGRVERQQKFMKLLAGEVLDSRNLLRLPQLVSALMANTNTDLSNKELLALFNAYKGASLGDLEVVMLEGEGEYINGVSYWVSNDEQIAALVQKIHDAIDDPAPTEASADGLNPEEEGAAVTNEVE